MLYSDRERADDARTRMEQAGRVPQQAFKRVVHCKRRGVRADPERWRTDVRYHRRCRAYGV